MQRLEETFNLYFTFIRWHLPIFPCVSYGLRIVLSCYLLPGLSIWQQSCCTLVSGRILQWVARVGAEGTFTFCIYFEELLVEGKMFWLCSFLVLHAISLQQISSYIAFVHICSLSWLLLAILIPRNSNFKCYLLQTLCWRASSRYCLAASANWVLN